MQRLAPFGYAPSFMREDVKVEGAFFQIDTAGRIDRPMPFTYAAGPFHAPAFRNDRPLTNMVFGWEQQPEMQTITRETFE